MDPLPGGLGSLQCHGSQTPLNELPSQILGSAIAGPDARFGVESVGGSQAFALRTNQNDDLYARANRCEFSFARDGARIPHDQLLWQTFSLNIDDWSASSDQQIIAQWHDGDHTVSKWPFFAFYVRGDDLDIVVRHNSSAAPSNATTTTKNVFSGRITANQWDDYVVEANVSHNPADSPFLKVWRDGVLIVDYEGPLGYNQPGVKDYAKLGFYHWAGGNAWDSSVPTRTVFVREASLVFDPDQIYSVQSLESLASTRR